MRSATDYAGPILCSLLFLCGCAQNPAEQPAASPRTSPPPQGGPQEIALTERQCAAGGYRFDNVVTEGPTPRYGRATPTRTLTRFSGWVCGDPSLNLWTIVSELQIEPDGPPHPIVSRAFHKATRERLTPSEVSRQIVNIVFVPESPASIILQENFSKTVTNEIEVALSVVDKAPHPSVPTDTATSVCRKGRDLMLRDSACKHLPRAKWRN